MKLLFSLQLLFSLLLLHFTPSSLPRVFAAGYGLDPLRSMYSQLTSFIAEQQRQLLSPPTDSKHGPSGGDIAAMARLSDPMPDLRDALDVMQSSWFEVWIGTWPAGIDWTRAVLSTHLASTCASFSKALLRYRSKSSHDTFQYSAQDVENDIDRCFTENIAYYFGEDAFSLRYQAYDDMLWVVLGWLESIKFIKDHSDRHYRFGLREPIPGKGRPWSGEHFIDAFAHRARIFWNIAAQGWDTKFCGGGMVWSPWIGPYKNAVTNELFITASVSMYLHFPGDNNTAPYMVDHAQDANRPPVSQYDSKFLHAAIEAYDWLENVGMRNEAGLYVDGFHIRNWTTNGTTCDIRNEMVYTYNQGVLLSGLRDLWESTDNITYLEDSHELARNVIRATGWSLDDSKVASDKWSGLGRAGILEDHCDAQGCCSQDSEMFKGIFMHHLALLCHRLPLTARKPGKTFGAGKDLMFLHEQSCKTYVPWVKHNALGAMKTRDEDGKFGTWWGAGEDVEVEGLPEGAVDCRNDALELRRSTFHELPWSDVKDGKRREQVTFSKVEELVSSAKTEPPGDIAVESKEGKDPNDRGRGRTVETHSGGVAVLRALWELLEST